MLTKIQYFGTNDKESWESTKTSVICFNPEWKKCGYSSVSTKIPMNKCTNKTNNLYKCKLSVSRYTL